MRLKDFINKLEKVVVYSADDEGNYFNQVHYSPTIGVFNDEDFTPVREDFYECYLELNSVCIN